MPTKAFTEKTRGSSSALSVCFVSSSFLSIDLIEAAVASTVLASGISGLALIIYLPYFTTSSGLTSLSELMFASTVWR